ncbi:hypothetical protein MJN69_29315, partial [Salmonella enterica subsp. enterica serovar Kentucky]|nr:hypothetical protein [Salmonella enterica subsp. enterica serovar Kentucky]
VNNARYLEFLEEARWDGLENSDSFQWMTARNIAFVVVNININFIDPDDIAEMFMMTTHNMPLNYLVDQLKEDVGEVIFVGIQPD